MSQKLRGDNDSLYEKTFGGQSHFRFHSACKANVTAQLQRAEREVRASGRSKVSGERGARRSGPDRGRRAAHVAARLAPTLARSLVSSLPSFPFCCFVTICTLTMWSAMSLSVTSLLYTHASPHCVPWWKRQKLCSPQQHTNHPIR